MCASIREFSFKAPVLARSDGTVADGHLRLTAAQIGIMARQRYQSNPGDSVRRMERGAGKTFRLMVNRSVTRAEWDEDLLSLELQELSALDFHLDLTGFNIRETNGLLAIPEEERAIAVVSERLGHADQNIRLSIYSHALPAGTKAAARIWNDAMADVIAEARKPKPEKAGTVRTLANVCTR